MNIIGGIIISCSPPPLWLPGSRIMLPNCEFKQCKMNKEVSRSNMARNNGSCYKEEEYIKQLLSSVQFAYLPLPLPPRIIILPFVSIISSPPLSRASTPNLASNLTKATSIKATHRVFSVLTCSFCCCILMLVFLCLDFLSPDLKSLCFSMRYDTVRSDFFFSLPSSQQFLGIRTHKHSVIIMSMIKSKKKILFV